MAYRRIQGGAVCGDENSVEQLFRRSGAGLPPSREDSVLAYLTLLTFRAAGINPLFPVALGREGGGTRLASLSSTDSEELGFD